MPQCASLIAEAISGNFLQLALPTDASFVIISGVDVRQLDATRLHGVRCTGQMMLFITFPDLYYFHAYILPISLSGLHVFMLCVKLYRVAWFATINVLSTGMHIHVFVSSCHSLPGLYMHACVQLYRVALFATINVLRTGNKFESNGKKSKSKYFLHLHHHVVFLK